MNERWNKTIRSAQVEGRQGPRTEKERRRGRGASENKLSTQHATRTLERTYRIQLQRTDAEAREKQRGTAHEKRRIGEAEPRGAIIKVSEGQKRTSRQAGTRGPQGDREGVRKTPQKARPQARASARDGRQPAASGRQPAAASRRQAAGSQRPAAWAPAGPGKASQAQEGPKPKGQDHSQKTTLRRRSKALHEYRDTCIHTISHFSGRVSPPLGPLMHVQRPAGSGCRQPATCWPYDSALKHSACAGAAGACLGLCGRPGGATPSL